MRLLVTLSQNYPRRIVVAAPAELSIYGFRYERYHSAELPTIFGKAGTDVSLSRPGFFNA